MTGDRTVLVTGTSTGIGQATAVRAAVAGWLGLAFCLVVMLFGAALKLPTWLMNISPFTHDRLLPAAEFSVAPVLLECVVVAGLVLAAYVGLRSRDLKQ